MVCCRTSHRLHKHDNRSSAEHHCGDYGNHPIDSATLRVTDRAGEQKSAAAPLNVLLNAGLCPHYIEAASDCIMEAVRMHGTQINDLHVQELMQ